MGEETFLVGVWLKGWEEKKIGGAWPLECFLPKKIVDKTGENKSGLKHPYFVALTLPRFSVLLFFFFFFDKQTGFCLVSSLVLFFPFGFLFPF